MQKMLLSGLRVGKNRQFLAMCFHLSPHSVVVAFLSPATAEIVCFAVMQTHWHTVERSCRFSKLLSITGNPL